MGGYCKLETYVMKSMSNVYSLYEKKECNMSGCEVGLKMLMLNFFVYSII